MTASIHDWNIPLSQLRVGYQTFCVRCRELALRVKLEEDPMPNRFGGAYAVAFGGAGGWSETASARCQKPKVRKAKVIREPQSRRTEYNYAGRLVRSDSIALTRREKEAMSFVRTVSDVVGRDLFAREMSIEEDVAGTGDEWVEWALGMLLDVSTDAGRANFIFEYCWASRVGWDWYDWRDSRYVITSSERRRLLTDAAANAIIDESDPDDVRFRSAIEVAANAALALDPKACFEAASEWADA